MDASLNTKYEPLVSGSSVPADTTNPEQWLQDLANFTETFSCGLPASFDETRLSNVIETIERTVRNLRCWVEKSGDDLLRKKVASGVSAALDSVRMLGHSVDRASESNLRVISRALDVGESLLLCHKIIKDLIVQSSAG